MVGLLDASWKQWLGICAARHKGDKVFALTLDEFLRENHVTREEWESSGADWSVLVEIANDHELRKDRLQSTAEHYARDLQKMDGVHSVRFRVKDTAHLLAKIVRKLIEKPEEYKKISAQSYHKIITDLVGIRAIHLFKDECIAIDKQIKDHFNITEGPIANIRPGDSDYLYRDNGIEIDTRDSGYRSIHYIVSDSSRKRETFSEIQVRTIFEEGWSEIDHQVRYPSFSDDETLKEFLGVFNRIAGAADEMGSFVRGLSQTVAKISEPLKGSLQASGTTGASIKLNELLYALSEKEIRKLNFLDGNGKTNFIALGSLVNKSLREHENSEEAKKPMDDSFSIGPPRSDTTGDYVSFVIQDGKEMIAGRISNTALAVLNNGKVFDSPIEVFNAHTDRIKKAAYEMRRMNPHFELIALGSNNFS
ncbi:RelA/SpoT domain-containing protein [Ralstonia sp. R-29]|uniref:RelA/SpoT domain-containing protein n=1 Tax=Ralstonia sp. R-29 TaxID=3404059 RepID=UPI003CE6B045